MGDPAGGALGGLFDPVFGNPGKAASEQQRNDTMAALAQLSPQAISALTSLFMPQIMARINPQLQTQTQQLGSSLAQRGLQESGVGANAEAGLRSASINNASQQAFQNAIGLAGQRAATLSGGFGQANNLLAGSISGLQQADPLIAGGGLKGSGTKNQPGGDFGVPGQPLVGTEFSKPGGTTHFL